MRRPLLLFLLLAIIPFMSANSERITFDDLYSYPQISDPQYSPDGKSIAFVIKTNDLDSGTSTNQIWIMNSDGSDLKQLIDLPDGSSHPRWSPDGKCLAFIADDDEGSQLYLMTYGEYTTRRVTSLWGEVSGAEWSGSSDKIIFYSSVYRDCNSDSCNRARSNEDENNPIRARLYDRLLFRHYDSWDDGTQNQLFIYDIAGDSAYQLTNGDYDAPTNILGGNTDYAFSPDGRDVCFVMNCDSIPALSTNNDLFIVPSVGGEPAPITDNKGQDNNPVYSPDGKYIAYLSQARAGYESDQEELILYDRKSGERMNLTANFDRSIGSFIWGPKSDFIYFLAIDHGYNKVWRINIKTTKVECLLDDMVYKDLRIPPDGKTLIVAGTLSDQPYELFSYNLKSKKRSRLTSFTKEWRKRLDMNRAEQFWFNGFNGDSVQGFIILPPDFDSTRQYPLAFLIHGGPQWCWLNDFNYYGWNTQLTAAQDYVVVQINPHGSVGYGLAFKEYVSGNWGKGDYDDLMLGVDYVLRRFPIIDSTRMAALGRSYGGFMTNWINGHTDRFKCLITIDGSFDQISGYYSTEELWFPEWEYKGTPYTNREEYIRSSPSTYAGNFRTPALIIHGQKDYRIDVSEAFQMFTALQRRGVPSQLLYFPDEGHAIRKLKNHRYVYEKQFEWLARWLKE
ncbi:MAG: S9 family peptidase [candidate division Zixibacteria bacterium HGW-Zixibacteria-1]|nr:MAG: S9 family peptidase [candidate division Zixibacteria bacterium HGW-Zixibacteria-1]